MENFFIGIFILLLSGVLSFFIKNQAWKVRFLSLTSFVALCFTLFDAIKTFIAGKLVYTCSFGAIFPSLTFSMDYLSAFFVVVISVMSFMAMIYANGYLKPYISNKKDLSSHCLFLPLLVASMLLVVTAQNALMFLIVWELMSLSSFFLVIFEHEKKEVIKAGVKYLVYMHVSVIFIIVAFALLSIQASSFDFAQFKLALENNVVLANIVFILAFIGFGIKAGFFPFHNWLPDAHPAAPSHVSGMMSGVMIKTGIYGILRVLTFVYHPEAQIGYFVLIISVISALYGVLYAISQHDIKRLLAYHSIENIGIIGIGIGIGMLGLSYNCAPVAILGFAGGILHILNHSIFKELLFLAAGSVYTKTHTRNIEILGGLIKSMPKTAVLFLIASIAICGLPPFNGFISEFLIYFGMLKGLLINNISMFIILILSIAGLALVGTMAILCFTKAFSIVFLGESRSENAKNVKEDTTVSFMLPMVILAVFIFLIGLFPKQAFAFMLLPVSIYVDVAVPEVIQTADIMQMISIIAFVVIVSSVVLFAIKYLFKNKNEKYVTWGCGYNKPTCRMQYSASSYASPFISMLTPLFKKVVDVKKPKTIFPSDAHFEMHMEDVEEAYFLKPLLKSVEAFFAKFEKIQNGNIQQYITYGLVFLALALVCVVILG